MKHFILLLTLFVCFSTNASAETMNLNWIVDGNTYAQTSCEYGGDIILPTAPTKYGYTFQGWAGYTFLEYIQSSGTQYIDTGVVRNVNSVGVITFSLLSAAKPATSQRLLWGNDDNDAAHTRFYIAAIPAGSFTLGLGSGYGNVSSVLDTNIHTAIINSKKTKVYFDDVQINSTTGYTSYVTPNKPIKITIFSKESGGAARVYSVRLYNDEDMLRDFIPARRDTDGEIGMYDTVTQTFFTNAGTGAFIAGPEL